MLNRGNQVSLPLIAGRGEVGVQVAGDEPRAVPTGPVVPRHDKVGRGLRRDVDRREANGAAGLVASADGQRIPGDNHS
eukprot:2021495-Alexandrium_andersonii.AAC.1